MKKHLCLSILMAVAATTQAQVVAYEQMINKSIETSNIDTVAWIHTGTLTLGVNQGILHNWAAGGELASLTINGLANGTITRYHHRHLWTNNMEAAYGLFYAYSNSFIARKTDDRIDLTSKYGYRLTEKSNFYFAGLFNAKTQFTKGYDYEIPSWDTFSTSNFISPLYLTLAPGIEYRKGSEISVFFSPAAARMTFVSPYYTNRSLEGAFGVPNGKSTRFELGAYLTARYQKDLTENIAYRTRLDLYSNYLAKDSYVNDELVKKDNPGNIDIMWDHFLSFKFFKYFSVNFGLTAIYDNDVPYEKTYVDANGMVQPKDEPFQGLGWWQIKQTFSVGFNYKF